MAAMVMEAQTAAAAAAPLPRQSQPLLHRPLPGGAAAHLRPQAARSPGD